MLELLSNLLILLTYLWVKPDELSHENAQTMMLHLTAPFIYSVQKHLAVKCYILKSINTFLADAILRCTMSIIPVLFVQLILKASNSPVDDGS